MRRLKEWALAWSTVRHFRRRYGDRARVEIFERYAACPQADYPTTKRILGRALQMVDR